MITALECNTKGLNDRLCGDSGVTKIHSVFACTILPPHDRLYAVLPVGVEMISPSPMIDVNLLPSMYKSNAVLYGEVPRSITTSFKTWKPSKVS